jgi:hypothetical protein
MKVVDWRRLLFTDGFVIREAVQGLIGKAVMDWE